CKREMPREEADQYFSEGRIGPLEGFISKRGRPFPAILYIKENGRHGFEFLPREKKTADKKTTKKAAKKTTKKAAKKTAKKTTKKAAKKTSKKAPSKSASPEEPPF
ncbi:MAG: topoisomerase C-terminal repeat-containing protein, partial [Candidatus Omnitrophica bacterium]|nr:topoisomerase C-terminal repeat-containing protein [Candidatus Omnitrophota bacterium]